MTVFMATKVKSGEIWLPRFISQVEQMEDISQIAVMYANSRDKSLAYLKHWQDTSKHPVDIYEDPYIPPEDRHGAKLTVVKKDIQKLLKESECDFYLNLDCDLVGLPRNMVPALMNEDKDLIAAMNWIEDRNPKQFFDSVAGDTPLLLRDKNTHRINILPIEDLEGNYENYEVAEMPENGTWTDIRAVTHHPFKGNLRRIRTLTGVIDVSKNHSIYLQKTHKKPVDADDITLGDRISQRDIPKSKGDKNKWFYGNYPSAWLLGLFLAEGHASITPKRNYLFIANEDQRMLNYAELTFNANFNRNCLRRKNGIECHTPEIVKYFRERFYTKKGYKKIPQEILNAPTHIRKAFITGYLDGDGYKNTKSKIRFDTNSKTAALGLIYLLRRNGENHRIAIRRDKTNIISVYSNKTNQQRKYVKEVMDVFDIPYEGELWDLTTDTHRFTGGVGLFLLHNTYEFRTEGCRFHPLNPPGKFDTEPFEVESVSTCYLAKAEVELAGEYRNPYPHIPFCKDLRDKGYSIWVHPGVHCTHIDLEALEFTRQPLPVASSLSPYIDHKGMKWTPEQVGAQIFNVIHLSYRINMLEKYPAIAGPAEEWMKGRPLITASYKVHPDELDWLGYSIESIYPYVDCIDIVQGPIKLRETKNKKYNIVFDFPDHENKIRSYGGVWKDKQEIQNKLLEVCRSKWMLFIDADEIIQGMEHVRSFAEENPDGTMIYARPVKFLNFWHDFNHTAYSLDPTSPWAQFGLPHPFLIHRDIPGLNFL